MADEIHVRATDRCHPQGVGRIEKQTGGNRPSATMGNWQELFGCGRGI